MAKKQSATDAQASDRPKEETVRSLLIQLELDAYCLMERIGDLDDESVAHWASALIERIHALTEALGERRVTTSEQAVFLMLCTDDEKRRSMEFIFDDNRTELVDEWIEGTCWKNDPIVRPLVGNKGSAEERLETLRKAFVASGLELWK